MKIPVILILFAALISLNGCSSISGNVVPKSGPDMEKVYDQMGQQHYGQGSTKTRQCLVSTIKKFRENNIAVNNSSSDASFAHKFHKIPNPELQMYIYPHLGGRDQIPVPGYTTEFNVYERDYYAI